MSILKNINAKSMVMFTLALGIIGAVSFINSPSAYAVAKNAVWTGASCYDAEAVLPDDCDWSVVGNWSSGIPVDGDSITFNTEGLTAGQNFGNNDNTDLQISSITFSGDPVEDLVFKVEGNEITITDGIYKDTSSGINLYLDIKLGGEVILIENNNSDGWLSFGNTDEIHNFNLNDKKVYFNYISGILIYDVIEGVGEIDINDISTTSDSYFRFYGLNTYEGTTTISSGTTVLDKDASFGYTEIIVGSLGNIMLYSSTDVTIDNIITIEGATENSPVTSLSFYSFYGDPITYTVPNIVLNGNTRLAADSSTTVDIEGITLNDYCIEYNGDDETRFLNGPVECEVVYGDPPATAPAVKAPDTAMSSFKLSNPLAILALGLTTAFSMILIARRKTSKR